MTHTTHQGIGQDMARPAEVLDFLLLPVHRDQRGLLLSCD